MIITENKVNVKYKTKNNKTADKPVFLAIKNQANANSSSIRNLRLIATRLCMVWLAGSLLCPLKNIIKARSAIRVNPAETAVISVKLKSILIYLITREPAASITTSSNASKRTDFIRGFKRGIIF
jgi:hypothetical protein